jgi:hypothetical protein
MTARRKPNLFIVGAMKCGTTAWYEYLRSHPDIYMPDLKEPGFFAFDLPKWRATDLEEEYSALFADSGAAKVIGDASPIYLMSNAAAQAIRDYNPAAKILIFLRDQEEYLPSLHNLNRLEFAESIDDFETAWRLSGRRRPETIPAGVEPRVLDYVAMGRFYDQVARYLEVFGADQVRVFWYRDWVADPRPTYRAILRFLELEDDGRSKFPVVNRGVRFRLRWLVSALYDPPKGLRRIVRLLKRVTGMRPQTQDKLVARTVALLRTPGYRKEISPSLREEIARFYADDNRRLNDLLASAGLAPAGNRLRA